MGLFTITIPESDITMLSISHWAIQLIDAVVMIAWSDTPLIQEQADAFGLETGISFFWHPPCSYFRYGKSIHSIYNKRSFHTNI